MTNKPVITKKLFIVGTAFLLQILVIKNASATYAKINPNNSTNGTTFLLIGNMEHSDTINNLSVKGLFHSLLFASYLYNKGMPSQDATNMYALFDVDYKSHGLPDLAPLQAIQYYSIYKTDYNNGLITTALKHNQAGDCINSGNCKLINDLIQSSTGQQRYIISMPNDDINEAVTALQQKYSYFKFDPIPSGSTGYNVLLSVSDKKSIIAQTDNDGINAPDSYPPIVEPFSQDPNFIKDVGLLKQGSSSIKYPSLKSGLNKNETVYLVRHVEKFADTGKDVHPDDGNYGCIGEWRALFNPDALYQIMGKALTDYLYAPNPTQPYNKGGYVRATTSISPFAIKFKQVESLAPKEIGIDGNQMYKYLFYTNHGGKLTGPNFNGKTVIVSWESANIEKMIKALSVDFKDDPNNSEGGIFGSGKLGGFENVIKIVIDAEGNLSVESLYEGISTVLIRESKACPTGFAS